MKPFEPTVDSLLGYECPQWFKDAKFGIYIHWGVYSVAEAGEWLARQMYEEGSAAYKIMRKKYGHPSVFGYKDLVPLWKAERFDPDAMLDLFKRAGARYFTPCAVHHDGFDLWNSAHNRWNAVKMGPKKDLLAMFREATLKAGLRFGVTTHLERKWSWMQTNKRSDRKGKYRGVPYDGNDPAYEDFYLPPDRAGDDNPWHPANPPKAWREHWIERMKDLIDNYHPDHLYFDGAVPFQGEDRARSGLEVISHFYNHNMARHDGRLEGVMCIKDTRMHGYYFDGIATLDYEAGHAEQVLYDPWQNDASVGPWGYNASVGYHSLKKLIHKLVDVVSKNGNLLLNVPPKADGTFDREVVALLEGMGGWLAANGEAIYGATPWWPAYRDFSKDVRFTAKKNAVYAIVLKWPENGKLKLPLLGLEDKGAPVSRITMLGADLPLRFSQNADALTVTLPAEKPGKFAWTLKIEM